MHHRDFNSRIAGHCAVFGGAYHADQHLHHLLFFHQVHLDHAEEVPQADNFDPGTFHCAMDDLEIRYRCSFNTFDGEAVATETCHEMGRIVCSEDLDIAEVDTLGEFHIDGP